VRGADLLDSTPRQIFLQRVLGLPSPRYAHLPLVVDAHGRKLSKSDAALPVNPDDPLPALKAAWRALEQNPAAIEAASDVASMLQHGPVDFDPGRIPRAGRITLAATHNEGFIFAS
jgi:glutamyl-Q tRNA(Asp) synthetase